MKLKLPLEREEILKILPHARFLWRIVELRPGKEAKGVARFPPDPLHFPDEPIVRGVDLLQACFEIGELMIRSLPENKNKRFKVGKTEISQPLPLFQGQDLDLKAGFLGVSRRRITVKDLSEEIIECHFVYKLEEVR